MIHMVAYIAKSSDSSQIVLLFLYDYMHFNMFNLNRDLRQRGTDSLAVSQCLVGLIFLECKLNDFGKVPGAPAGTLKDLFAAAKTVGHN